MTETPARSQTTAAAPADQLRVGDAERDAVAALLADHHAAGRLTPEEFGQRLDAALTARTRAELAVPLADLPSAPPVAAPVAPSVRPAASTADPGRRVHLLAYVVTIAALWLVWFLTGAGHAWPIYPMLGWGLGLLGNRIGAPCRPHTGGRRQVRTL